MRWRTGTPRCLPVANETAAFVGAAAKPTNKELDREKDGVLRIKSIPVASDNFGLSLQGFRWRRMGAASIAFCKCDR
jgi:hypothetical protein